LAAEDPDRARGGFGDLAELFAGQSVQPLQRPLDVRLRESGLLQFQLEHMPIRPRFVIGAHVILEQIYK